jgi:DNA repair exonuclease SbcCD nuclease subunit
MKMLVINDPHTTDKPMLGRTESYGDDIIAKLMESWEIAHRTGCDFVLMTGDIFHKFRGPLVQYRMLNRLLVAFRASGLPIFAVAGNHDLSYSGVVSVPDMPIGVLVTAGVIEWLDKARIVEFGSESALLIPRNWEPYIDTVPTAFKLKAHEAALRAENRYTIMVAHASILPPGETRPFPYHAADKLPTDLLDILICGHIHEDLGIHKLTSGCWYCNIGALSRDSRTKHNLTRIPEVLTITLEHGEIEFERHPLQCAKPADEIFYDKEVIVEHDLTDFADALMNNLELEETPMDEFIASYTKDQPAEVADRLRQYLEEAEHGR